MRDASPLTLDELSKEGELLVVGHDVGGTTNLALCDEHFQMGHDFVFELLEWAEDQGVRSKQMSVVE